MWLIFSPVLELLSIYFFSPFFPLLLIRWFNVSLVQVYFYHFTFSQSFCDHPSQDLCMSSCHLYLSPLFHFFFLFCVTSSVDVFFSQGHINFFQGIYGDDDDDHCLNSKKRRGKENRSHSNVIFHLTE